MARIVTKIALAAAVLSASGGFAGAQTVGFATLPPGAINNVQMQVIAKVFSRTPSCARGSFRFAAAARSPHRSTANGRSSASPTLARPPTL